MKTVTYTSIIILLMLLFGCSNKAALTEPITIEMSGFKYWYCPSEFILYTYKDSNNFPDNGGFYWYKLSKKVCPSNNDEYTYFGNYDSTPESVSITVTRTSDYVVVFWKTYFNDSSPHGSFDLEKDEEYNVAIQVRYTSDKGTDCGQSRIGVF